MNVNHAGGTFSDQLMRLGGSDHMIYKKGTPVRQIKRQKKRASLKRRQVKSPATGFG
tara:strand:+ start:315 stop:485 length:171 start_codon:yes stop_codon:yes gene_type:complete